MERTGSSSEGAEILLALLPSFPLVRVSSREPDRLPCLPPLVLNSIACEQRGSVIVEYSENTCVFLAPSLGLRSSARCRGGGAESALGLRAAGERGREAEEGEGEKGNGGRCPARGKMERGRKKRSALARIPLKTYICLLGLVQQQTVGGVL